MAIKNEIALILEQSRGTAVSGQELADRLGVSRAAVWKAVKQLQDEGYSISAGTNRGYMLESGSDVLTAEGIRLHLTEKYRGIPVEVYFKGSLVKVEIALAKGKKLYDKRADIAKKDQKREAQRDFKIRNLG